MGEFGFRLADITVEGFWFLDWYNRGVTDPEDLCWCIEFYRGQAGWNRSQALFAMNNARKYREWLDRQNRVE